MFAYPKNNIRVTQNFKGDKHPALDFGGVRIGDKKVWSIGDGIVEKVGYNSVRGNFVEVYHKNEDMTSIYWHLANTKVTEGQVTTKDTYIGEEGDTGNSRGKHLHFGLYKGRYTSYTKDYVNPLDYLRAYPEQKLYKGQSGNDIDQVQYYKGQSTTKEQNESKKHDYAKIGMAAVALYALLKD